MPCLIDIFSVGFRETGDSQFLGHRVQRMPIGSVDIPVAADGGGNRTRCACVYRSSVVLLGTARLS